MCLSIIVDHPEVLIEKGLYQNYEWVITHNQGGYRCGYIKLNPDDPYYGKLDTLNIVLNVHGHITFSEADKRCNSESTIKTTEFVRTELYNLIDQILKLKRINNYEYTIYYS